MKGFEQYDLRAWLDNGLSYHPEPVKPLPAQVDRAGKFLTKIAVPLMMLGAADVVQAAAVSRLSATPPVFQAMHAVRYDPLLIAAQSPSVILNPGGHATIPQSTVDEFDTLAAALLGEVRAGLLTNVSAETLRLATEAVERHADTNSAGRPEWVDKVAKDVAQLTD